MDTQAKIKTFITSGTGLAGVTPTNVDAVAKAILDGFNANEDKAALVTRLQGAAVGLNAADADTVATAVLAEKKRIADAAAAAAAKAKRTRGLIWTGAIVGLILLALAAWFSYKGYSEAQMNAGARDMTELKSGIADLKTGQGEVKTAAEGAKTAAEGAKTAAEGAKTAADANGTKLATLDTNLNTVNNNVVRVAAGVKANGTKLATLDSNLTALDGKVTANGTKLATLDSNLTALDGKVVANGVALAKIDSDLTQVQGLVTANNSMIAQSLTRTVRCRRSDPACVCKPNPKRAGKQICQKTISVTLRGGGYGHGTRTAKKSDPKAGTLAVLRPDGKVEMVQDDGVKAVCSGTYTAAEGCVGSWVKPPAPTVVVDLTGPAQ